MHNLQFSFDSALQLKDAGLVASSAAAQVSSADKILDLGDSASMEAYLVIDATAIEVGTGDEKYEILWQTSSSPTFASDILTSASLLLGDSSVTASSADSAAGRYVILVSNTVDNTPRRYGRLYTRIAGTIATGINYSAFLAPRIP